MHSLLASSRVDAASQALVPKNKAAPLCRVNPIGTFQFLHLDNAAPTLRRQANTQFTPRLVPGLPTSWQLGTVRGFRGSGPQESHAGLLFPLECFCSFALPTGRQMMLTRAACVMGLTHYRFRTRKPGRPAPAEQAISSLEHACTGKHLPTSPTT